MKLITVTDDNGTTVEQVITGDELDTLSGVQLAGLLYPNPTPGDIHTINTFLDRYRNTE